MHCRFKTAEAAWSQEKAQYRHEAEAQKKKAHKLQLEYEKLQVHAFWSRALCSLLLIVCLVLSKATSSTVMT